MKELLNELVKRTSGILKPVQGSIQVQFAVRLTTEYSIEVAETFGVEFDGEGDAEVVEYDGDNELISSILDEHWDETNE